MSDKLKIVVKPIEIAFLDLKYAHSRIRNNKAVEALSNSIARHGQITPVIVVTADEIKYVLIDGYLRVAALKRHAKDTVVAQIWHCSEQQALVQVLARIQDRKWEMFEQAVLLRDLHVQQGLTLAQIAGLLGKDHSYISRRIALLECLDDEIQAYIRKGQIPFWSASRVLVPMARANPDHARTLTRQLAQKEMATRQLAVIFEHYKKSNQQKRANIVARPHLFLKALEQQQTQRQAAHLSDGIEGNWIKDINIVGHMLNRLVKDCRQVFYQNQSNLERRLLLTAFKRAERSFLSLTQTVRRMNDLTTRTPGHLGDAPKRDRDTQDQPVVKTLPQNDPAGNCGQSTGCTSHACGR